MRLGLIGAGRWGKRYIETISHMDELQLVHVGSRQKETKDLVPNTCTISPNWIDVACNQTLDGLIIATPPHLHYEMAVSAISSGIPVLIEKPLTLSLREAEALVKQAKQSKTLVMVGHTHLFGSAYQELKKIGKSLGTLRKITSMGSNWGPFREDTSMMWDYAPHDLAMCLDLFENYPSTIHAQRIKKIKSAEGEGETIKINLDFVLGSSAEIKVSNIEEGKCRYLEASFEKGTLIYDDLELEHKLKLKNNQSNASPISLSSTRPLTNVVSQFCQKISEGEVEDSSLVLGMQVVQILENCQSILDNHTIEDGGTTKALCL